VLNRLETSHITAGQETADMVRKPLGPQAVRRAGHDGFENYGRTPLVYFDWRDPAARL